MNRSWNDTAPPYSAQYTAIVTIDGTVDNETASGGIVWTVQGGSMLFNGSTFTITGGRGQVSNMDRLTIVGTATDSDGHTFRWQFQGLAAMYNGTVIAEINGRSFAVVNGTIEGASLTCIATIS